MRILLALSLLTLTMSIATAQQASAPKQILFDFRANRPVTSPKISRATEKLVLSKVFKKYLTDENKCNRDFAGNGNDDYLKAARVAGQIVPSIVDATTGSFTATGQTETAYVISVSECNASHADNFGTKRIAIFAGQNLVADLDVDFNSSIVRKTDLNGDGIDELLMASGDMAQGTLTEMATLMTFQRGKLQVIEDFATVNEDSCASGFPGSSIKTSVLSFGPAEPGKMPKVRQDNYSARCRNPRKWRFVSTGRMQD
ncbi:MAG TPA: hypothetical protein VGQ39_24950 [Pyrinomonadaceae bacterium]|jgi:hypothetical protein|nr:hypothetical protein [Pyrinomonadaceae bacterium]